MQSFIGIDMAWNIEGNHSGVAALTGDAGRVRLDAVSTGVTDQAGIVQFVRDHAAASTVVAIDASLVVKNTTGQRPCETMIAREFGEYHASCHTSNLDRDYATTGMKLVQALAGDGFLHDFRLDNAQQRPGRWVFEVYPHPAMVRLFNLKRIIKYKKGTVARKRAGLAELGRHLQSLAAGRNGLVRSDVFDALLSRDLDALRGEALKRHEDTLDAVFCGYLAWYCWRWGAERNQQFGTFEEGYIVVPKAIGS